MPQRTLRPVSLATCALLIGGGLALLPAVSASAAPVTTFSALQSALGGSGEVVLGADISAPSDTLSLLIATAITLDLAGYDLDVLTVQIPSGSELTIEDSVGGGTLDADASSITGPVYADARAGIAVPAGATLVIESGTVRATGGGEGAAGIGAQGHGGWGDFLGDITINGGTVTATASTAAAGIGNAAVATGGSISITGGTVTASAGGTYAVAGIGGGFASRVDTITISGGTVNATGSRGAGIGGGSDTVSYPSDGAPVITISGGTITAASELGAGIGAGSYAGPGTGSVTISAGTVTASSTQGAGIGSGNSSGGLPVSITGGTVSATAAFFPAVGAWSGGSVTIGSAASVTGASGNTAVGVATGDTDATINGTLTLPAGSFLRAASSGSLTIGATGRVIGEGQVGGTGTITNNGAIAVADVAGTILVNNYLVGFDGSDDVRVYATTFAAGARELPADPTSAGLVFQGWFTEPDGDGDEFTVDTVLTEDITVYPYFTAAPAPAPGPALAATGSGSPWVAAGLGAGILLLGALLLLRRRTA